MCFFLHDGLSFQNHMAQRHHLSKALVVSLMKIHHLKKVFVKGRRKNPLIWSFLVFDTSLKNDSIKNLPG